MVLAALLAMPTLSALAHPHVFIDNRMTIRFDGDLLKGVSVTWNFDKMFSSMMLTDIPAQTDGSFTLKNAADLKAGAFDNLVNYHYFLVFQAGKKTIPIRIQQFTPSVVGGTTLVYSFFVPLNIPVTEAEQTLRITVYDDTYYVAFSLMHLEDMTVEGAQDVSCRLSVEKTTVKPAWPGQYMPDQLVIRMKKAS